LRRAIGSLTAAAAWERTYLPGAVVGRIDIEAGFLLGIPLLDLPPGITGTCRLTMQVESDSDPRYAGVALAVVESRITSCVTRLDGDVDAWIAGSPVDWFRWMAGSEDEGIELGGETWVARGVLASLRDVLMPLPSGVR
jgi:hypothetical protein